MQAYLKRNPIAVCGFSAVPTGREDADFSPSQAQHDNRVVINDPVTRLVYVLDECTVCPIGSSQIRCGTRFRQSIAASLFLKVMHAAILQRSFLSQPSPGRPPSLCNNCILYSRLESLYGSLEKIIRMCLSFVLKKRSNAFK